MKFRYYLIIFFLVSLNILHAQNCHTGTSIEKKLSGTWQWINGNDTLTIQLSYTDTLWKSHVTNDIFGPKIYGWHRYVENSVLIESTFLNSSVPSIFGTVINKEKLFLLFHDISRGRDFRIEPEFLDSTGTIMKWVTSHPQEQIIDPKHPPKVLYGQTIPSPIILHKISD